MRLSAGFSIATLMSSDDIEEDDIRAERVRRLSRMIDNVRVTLAIALCLVVGYGLYWLGSLVPRSQPGMETGFIEDLIVMTWRWLF